MPSLMIHLSLQDLNQRLQAKALFVFLPAFDINYVANPYYIYVVALHNKAFAYRNYRQCGQKTHTKFLPIESIDTSHNSGDIATTDKLAVQ